MTLPPPSKPPTGKLAPLAPLAPITRNVPTLAPISSQPRPTTGINQKSVPNAASAPVAAASSNNSSERPKTSRGHAMTSADEKIVAETVSPKKVLGGGSRFLKKSDSVDLKGGIIKSTRNVENKAQVLKLNLNPSTVAEKKSLLYASLGLSDNSESDSDADDVPTPSIVENAQLKTNETTVPKQNAEINQHTVVLPVTAVKPPLLITEKLATVTSNVKMQSAAAVKPAVNAPANQDNVKMVLVEMQERETSKALQDRLSKFKLELEKREQEEKEKIRKEHEILLEKMRDDHKSEKLRIEKEFEQKLIEFKNERRKVDQKEKDEFLLDDEKLIDETKIKLRKENDTKLADLRRKLDQDFESERQKLVADQKERMDKLKQDMDRQFEEYKFKLEYEIDSMKADEFRKVESRIQQQVSSSKSEKSCQVTMEEDNIPQRNPDPENHFLDQSMADLHLELEGMRRDLRDLTGVVKELKKLDMPAPAVKKDVRHVEKHAKPKNKKKQKFIRSLDEFLTSCDEDRIKHDPVLGKLETDDTIKKARQFINNQNFRPNTSRINNYSWKFETKDNVDEMINARLRQVFPESNTFSSLFGSMNDRRESSPLRKCNVQMELESLKNWLKKFEKDIK